MPASGSSSELSSHQMAIRSHPGVQKMPACGISSELSAHQMARPGAIAHSRPTSSNAFLSFLSSFVSPLLPLGLGFLVATFGAIRLAVLVSLRVFVFRKWDRLLGISFFAFSLSFPPASFSLLAFFQTLRRNRCRLLRQRLNFSTPSRVVVTSALADSERHWSPSDWQSEHSCCRHGHVSQETTRQARALRTRRRAVSSRSVRRSSVGERRVTHSSILLNSPSLKVQSTVLPLQRGIDWRIHLVLPLRLAGVDIEGHSQPFF